VFKTPVLKGTPKVSFINILPAAFFSFAKKLQRQTVSREKLLKTLLNEKAAHKMVVKLITKGIEEY
jgi:hypothetical protein